MGARGMAYGVRLKVWGDYACFTRPEMKVERVSYDVITPLAGRGVFEAIFWEPGIRWRVRRTGDPAERARTAVTWRIRNAVKKIEPEHPALARHLRNAVHSGTWCSYEPEVPVEWRF